MWTAVAALVIAARTRRACPTATPVSVQSNPQGSNRASTPAIPRERPTHLARVILSPRKMAAIGTVHRLLVHTTTDERPAGTSSRAEKTRTVTAARRNSAIDPTMGRSLRGGGDIVPLARATTTMSTVAVPMRNAPIQIGATDLTPVAITGQLRPRISTTSPSRA
jgi:hypothetical protein